MFLNINENIRRLLAEKEMAEKIKKDVAANPDKKNFMTDDVRGYLAT